MNDFAELLDRLAYEPSRNNKLRLIADYLRTTPDPERGYALAALTGALSFQHAKAGVIRALIAERTDPVLFELSYDYVGDLSETVALMWPAPHATSHQFCAPLRDMATRALPSPLPFRPLRRLGERVASAASRERAVASRSGIATSLSPALRADPLPQPAKRPEGERGRNKLRHQPPSLDQSAARSIFRTVEPTAVRWRPATP